jgi:hypothetical protein
MLVSRCEGVGVISRFLAFQQLDHSIIRRGDQREKEAEERKRRGESIFIRFIIGI